VPADAEIYCNCMDDLPSRMRLVRLILYRTVTTGADLLDTEIVFLQFRKILEQIAFASLAANKEAYSAARAKFADEWRAKKMLEYLAKVNPEFYPVPLRVGSIIPRGDGTKFTRLELLTDGFLTKNEFVELYDYCADILHARNPYDSRSRTINIRLHARDWLSRIEQLVGLHQAQLLSGGCWIAAVPDKDGKVHVYPAVPVSGEPPT
jgi:hypothetical protein